jgi:two-component system LytT family response regulator
MTPITMSTVSAIRQEIDHGTGVVMPPRSAGRPVAITALVSDAEHRARAHLASFLGRLPEVERVIECASGTETVEVIRAQRPNLVFLEVRLPGLSGFEVIQTVSPARMPPVVFVTECEEHAAMAFEVDALDYLLKPFDDRRCLVAVERARRRLEVATAAAVHPLLQNLAGHRGPGEVVGRLAVKLQGRTVIVRVEDIDWLEARDNYVRLHVGSAHYLVRGKISSFEMRLDSRRFLRVHRGALVNIDRIMEVRSGPRGEAVVLTTGAHLPVGSTRREELLQRLGFSAGPDRAEPVSC